MRTINFKSFYQMFGWLLRVLASPLVWQNIQEPLSVTNSAGKLVQATSYDSQSPSHLIATQPMGNQTVPVCG